MFMSKDKNLRFFIWEHEDVNVLSFMYSDYAYKSKLEVCILQNSLKKGSEIRRKIRCFYLCVMSNAFIFDGFLSMGDICFFVYISKNREVVLIDVLFLPECWGNNFCVELLRELIVEKVWM